MPRLMILRSIAPLCLLVLKGFQSDLRRLILVNLVVPIVTVCVIFVVRVKYSAVYLPDVRFAPFSVNDPSRTQLVGPRSTEIGVRLVEVDNLFLTNMTKSNISHDIDLKMIEENIRVNLKPLQLRDSSEDRISDIEVFLSRVEGIPHAAISVMPASTPRSPFVLSNLILHRRRSIVLSRELDLFRDGTVFVMHQIASAFTDQMPNINVKIDDLHGRPIDAFVEEYHRLMPSIILILIALRVISMILRMMDERARRVHLGLMNYGIPRSLNITAWIITAFCEVAFDTLWLQLALVAAAASAGSEKDPLLSDLHTNLYFYGALLGFSFMQALFGIFCVLTFGFMALYVYIGTNVLHVVFYLSLMNGHEDLCLLGATHFMVTFGGPYTLAVALRLSAPANLPVMAERQGIMRCAGKDHLDLVTYLSVTLIQSFWCALLLAFIFIYIAVPLKNESYRWARTQYPSTRQFSSKCFQFRPPNPMLDTPIMQPIGYGEKIVMAMRNITYWTADGEMILDNFCLTIPAGHIVSLVGDVHDAGDAVMSILSGICTKYRGVVTYHGELVDPEVLSNSVSVCPSEPFLIQSMSIKRNVKVFLSARHTVDTMTRFASLMQELGMNESYDIPFAKLSASAQRKVSICMALLAPPEVIILEEPSKDLTLDDISKLSVLLHREQRSRGMLLITKNAEFAESVSERVNLAFGGSVVYSGSVTGLVQDLLELPQTIVMYMHLPPKDGVRKSAEFNNMKLLGVIKDLHDGVRVTYVSRQRVVLQVHGTEQQLLQVYEAFRCRQRELNIQKIIVTEPSLCSVFDLADKKENLTLVGEQRQIHRGIRDKWDSCKTGLRRQSERLRLETLFKQTKRTCYMAWTYSVRRGILPMSIMCTTFLVMLDSMFYPVTPTGPVVQMRSFHKKLYGIFCDNSSYSNTPKRYQRQIITALKDTKSPPVSTRPGSMGQICLEVQANGNDIEDANFTIHTPVTAVHDFVVFLSRLYDAMIAPKKPIYWYYRESRQASLVRFLSDELSSRYWSWEFTYLVLSTMLVSTDMYFFGRCRVYFTKGRLVQSGLRISAFWMGVIAFTITKNTILLVAFDLRACQFKPPFERAEKRSDLWIMRVGTIVLGTAHAAMLTSAVANLVMTEWLRTEMLTSLFLVNLVCSVLLFFVESFIYDFANDKIAGYLILLAGLLPAYQLVLTSRRLKLSSLLSAVCSQPEITEDVCPRYPSLAPLCCEKACNLLFGRCTYWDFDAYSWRTGVGRYVSLGILFSLHLVFLAILLFNEAQMYRHSPYEAANEEKIEQMRLQKRRRYIDSYGIAEAVACRQINPAHWSGLLVMDLSIYGGDDYLLKDVTFSVAPGQMVAIFGKEGPARTKLLRAAAGVEAIEEGTKIHAVRYRLPLPPNQRRVIGLACGIDELPDDVTVEDYLDIYNTIRNVPAGWQKYHLDLTLRVFGIEKIRKISIGTLNYPKKKIVSIASAFVGCPQMIILDDPLGGLDRADHERMCNALNSLKSRDTAILFSSSSLEDSSLVNVDKAGVLIGSELVTIRHLPDLLILDTGYHIIVRLQPVSDRGGPRDYEQQKNVVLKVLAAKFPEARLVLQVGCMCEFHIRGVHVSCPSINEVKRTIVETLTQAQEIKIGYLSGERRLLYLMDVLIKNKHGVPYARVLYIRISSLRSW